MQLNKVDAVIDFVDALANGDTSADGSGWSKVRGLIEVMVGLKIEVPCKVEKPCFRIRSACCAPRGWMAFVATSSASSSTTSAALVAASALAWPLALPPP